MAENMMIDGDIVEIGDKLWDNLGRAFVTVESVSSNRVNLVGGGVVFPNGIMNDRKRFYWMDPVTITPRKADSERMGRIRSIAALVK